MEDEEITSLKIFFHETIFNFYRMALGTQEKIWDDVLSTPDGKEFWQRQIVAKQLFGRKLNRLLIRKKGASATGGV